jgi:hypothetical protein
MEVRKEFPITNTEFKNITAIMNFIYQWCLCFYEASPWLKRDAESPSLNHGIYLNNSKLESRDSSVSIVIVYGPDCRGSIPRQGQDYFVHSVRTGSGAPPSLFSNWYRWHFSVGLKRPEHSADLSPPSSAEVKNRGAIPPLPHMCSWLCAELIKHRDNFLFYK